MAEGRIRHHTPLPRAGEGPELWRYEGGEGAITPLGARSFARLDIPLTPGPLPPRGRGRVGATSFARRAFIRSPK